MAFKLPPSLSSLLSGASLGENKQPTQADTEDFTLIECEQAEAIISVLDKMLSLLMRAGLDTLDCRHAIKEVNARLSGRMVELAKSVPMSNDQEEDEGDEDEGDDGEEEEEEVKTEVKDLKDDAKRSPSSGENIRSLQDELMAEVASSYAQALANPNHGANVHATKRTPKNSPKKDLDG